MNQIMADGKTRRIFINGKEYCGCTGSGGTTTVSDTALLEFVITAADPANTPLLVNTVIVMTDEHGNVTTLVSGGREIRVVKGTYQIDVTCEDVGDWDDTRAITADEVIEIELGMSMLDGRWGYPAPDEQYRELWEDVWLMLWSNQAQGVAFLSPIPPSDYEFNPGNFSQSVGDFAALWEDVWLMTWSNQAQGVAVD